MTDKLEKLKKENFLVFGEDFGRHPHSLEHLLRRFLPENRIIWVEMIGLRLPKFCLYDLKRAWGLLKKWLRFAKSPATDDFNGQLVVVSPIIFPFNNFSFIQHLNNLSIKRTIKKALQERCITSPILVTSIPSIGQLCGQFGEKLSVYYCVDEFSLWPGLLKSEIIKLEAELIEKVDVIITTAEKLYETKKRQHKNTFLLTHGVDIKHFSLPAKSLNDRIFRIVYFGFFDERSDQVLLQKIARTFPDASLEIIGNIGTDVSSLRKLKNIHFYCQVPYDSLPQYLQNADVFILPYFLSALSMNINPLKLKEYLATERPVVSTPLPEVLKLGNLVHIAESHEQFLKILDKIRKKELHLEPSLIKSFIESESWEKKAKTFSLLLQTAVQKGFKKKFSLPQKSPKIVLEGYLY